MLRCIIFIFLFFIPAFLTTAQGNSDLAIIGKHSKSALARIEKSNNKIKLQKSLNPGAEVALVLLFFYQKIFSEQMSAICEFDLSCSRFGISSIKEFGIIKGICLTADRLTRCNGQAHSETENYLINHANGKVLDEPSMYRFTN